MAHVGILFCLYDHLKQLKEENIMAYMSEEGYKKLMAELRNWKQWNARRSLRQ